MDTFDLIVIGGGPGGYVCALRAAQLGLKAALVEKGPTLGGTCLNIGCIPSKALLHMSELYHFAAHDSEELGISIPAAVADIPAMMRRKAGIVAKLVGGIDVLVQRRGIERVRGHGALEGGGKVAVTHEGQVRHLQGRAIVLATGSAPVELPFLKFNGTTVVSSDHALAFESVPERLVVVGAGAIGLELGSVWNRLGSEVTVVELLPRIAPGMDDDAARHLERSLGRQGLQFELGARVTGLREDEDGVVLLAERDGKPLEFPASRILVAVGRAPYTTGLGLEAAGVKLDERRRIQISSRFETSAPGVFAIGDIVAGPMLAHKAEEEGVAVAEIVAGRHAHVDHDLVPGVVYTNPEAASVGLTEAQAKEHGLEVRTGKFNLGANGRALATGDTDGFVKVVADAKTDRVLGVHIVARHASELIAAAVAHMTYGGSAEDMGRTIYAHPTTSEAMKEAALAVSKSAIHGL